jgi:iron(III) transport system substrate-binding protein
MKKVLASAALAGAVLLGWLALTRTPAPEVVVYSSVDDVFARPVAEQFEQATGIVVQLVPDTEETKSTGLLNRLIAERNRPRADVFWSGDPVRAGILKDKNVTEPYRSPQAAGLPAAYSDPAGHWTGFSARARVLIYNREQVPEGQAPHSIMDLLEERFRNRACMANPLFGTTSMHAAALFAALGEERAIEFFEGFLANGGTVLSSNGEVRRRVAAGEFALGITDTDDANVALLDGKPIGVVYPDAAGLGTLIVPNAAVLIRNGPNPAAGRRFIDYLLHPETEATLAASEAAQIPLRPGVPAPDNVVTIEKITAMPVDYAELAGALEQLSAGYLKDWVDRAGR